MIQAATVEKIGVINWLLPAFYKRDETILPQIVDPSKLENWKQVTEKVVLAAASVNSDIKTSRISVSGVDTQAKNYGIGHTRTLYAQLNSEEVEFWKAMSTADSVAQYVRDRVRRAKPWAPLCPPENPDEEERTLENSQQARVEESRAEIDEILALAGEGMVRPSQLIYESEGVVNAAGLVNTFTNADTSRVLVSAEEQQRADSNKYMKKVKNKELLLYCTFFKLDTTGFKAHLVNKIMDHVSLNNGNLDEVGQALLNNPERYVIQNDAVAALVP